MIYSGAKETLSEIKKISPIEYDEVKGRLI